MSFDWLNVPGLNTGTDDRQSSNLPTVSFNFGDSSNTNNDLHFLDETMKSSSDPALVRKLDSQGRDVPPASGAYLQQNGLHRSQEVLSEPQNRSRGNTLNSQSHNPIHQLQDDYKETPEDLRVPLSLSQAQLTHEELRTYIRWYNYITARTHGKLIKLTDIFQFMKNFNITEELKNRIFLVFRSCKNALNIGQFFAVLRLLAKALLAGVLPNRQMILEKAPIPRPRPILNKEGGNEFYEEIEEDVPETSGDVSGNQSGSGEKVDFDSFASLLLTGKKVRKRVRRKVKNSVFKNKKVRFAEKVTFQDAPHYGKGKQNQSGQDTPSPEDDSTTEDGPLDLSLPMDQLLKQMAKRKKNSALVSSVPTEQQETEEEREILSDMKDSLSHFKQIQAPDSVTQIPPIIAQDGNQNGSTAHNSTIFNTGIGIMNQFPTPNNAVDNAEPELQPLKPTATGSANYLMKSHMDTSAPAPQFDNPPIIPPANQTEVMEPLKPTATGSANYLMKQQFKPPTTSHPPVPQQMSSPEPNGQVFSNQSMNMHSMPLSPNSTNQQNMLPQTHGQNLQPQISQMQQNTTQGMQQHIPQMQQQNNTQQQLPQQATPQLVVQPQAQHQNHITINPPQTQQSNHQQTFQPTQQQQPIRGPNNSQTNGLQLPNNTGMNNLRVESPSMLSPNNAAGNYFQSLLSHSPSPNNSQTNIHSNLTGQLSPNLSYGNNIQTAQPTIGQQRMQQTGTGQQLPIYNNNNSSIGVYNQYQQPPIQHQNSQPPPQQNRPPFGNMQQHQPQQGVPQYFQSDIQGSYNTNNQRYMNNASPVGNNQGMPTSNQISTQDILGNLQSLKQQVDALQNQYSGR
ncbi:Protein SCD5 [Nakaseomyces bracarensis]|uniref:Protein SCD5 n=1 Tax=Nakaseomyces bracarensis TaxID=273131 RepID=A0ABR4NP49_9SACH